MNNYCRECGEKLEINAKECLKCNAVVLEKRINIEEKTKEIEAFKKKENKYIAVILSLYIVPYILNFIVSIISNIVKLPVLEYLMILSPLSSFAGMVTLIYARITMSESKKIRTLFIIFLILTIMGITALLLLMITCGYFVRRNCN